jgi:hypothetical protein
MGQKERITTEATTLGYEIQEYRVVPDFSGRKPLLGKESVNGK